MLHHLLAYCAAHQVPEDEAATVTEFGRDTGLALAGERRASRSSRSSSSPPPSA